MPLTSFSKLMNFRKSHGSGIVAMRKLPVHLDALHPLERAFLPLILPIMIR